MGVLSAEKQADILKDRGNTYFKKEKLGAAIEAYTEAISLCPRVPVYWTNRALCERKRNEWEKVEADCRRALELDSHSFKAYYLLGLALLHYQQYEEAVNQLEKAMDLNRGATQHYMVEDIWQELSKARLAEWKAVSDVRLQQQLDLKCHVASLLKEDYDRQLQAAHADIRNAASGGGVLQQSALRTKLEALAAENGGGAEEDGDDGGKEMNHADAEQFFTLTTAAKPRRPPLRSLSEPARSMDVTGTAFDPLRHHKLSRRRSTSRSSSIQRHQSTSNADDVAAPKAPPTPDTAGISRPPTVATRDRVGSEARESPASMPPRAPAVAYVPRPETTATNFGEGAPDGDHSIKSVFKVFKEFMKLQRNESGQRLLRVIEMYQRRSKVLEEVFDKVAAPDQLGEIPDHLCCKITMDIFRDPVITSSGITYERSAILEHLRKVGHFDPFTRAPLTEEQVVPNLALKEAVQAFLKEHGWAYGPC